MTLVLTNKLRVTPLILALALLSCTVIAASLSNDTGTVNITELWWDGELSPPSPSDIPSCTPIGEAENLTGNIQTIGDKAYLFRDQTLISISAITEKWTDELKLKIIDLGDRQSLKLISQDPASTSPPPSLWQQTIGQLHTPGSPLIIPASPRPESSSNSHHKISRHTSSGSILYEPAFSGILGLAGIGFASYLLLKTGRRPKNKP